MKSTMRTAVVLMAFALSLTGCDFFRSLVGKPTSAELEQMKLEAQAKIERERFVADSIKAAEEAARLAALQSSEFPSVEEGDPRFHVIIGCFKVQNNAVNLRKVLTDNGYNPKKILFKNGFDAVSLFQSDNLEQAMRALWDFKDSPYCPEDIWIYDMKNKLHE